MNFAYLIGKSEFIRMVYNKSNPLIYKIIIIKGAFNMHKIGIIGGGQLGKMMILDAKRLDDYFVILDPTCIARLTVLQMNIL